jgi:hypothetical protein
VYLIRGLNASLPPLARRCACANHIHKPLSHLPAAPFIARKRFYPLILRMSLKHEPEALADFPDCNSAGIGQGRVDCRYRNDRHLSTQINRRGSIEQLYQATKTLN